ncbi:hypothetical protein Pcinc_027116 [Petrolisthes cinctipes]|uniref:Uncharacterized protein n=1 Tax=Petrolisthes cinctipes TaxID=88211 RepID=A0AAE1F556_PETCI|nr:hypothetical protein Pcinc_027116 [Petrolisthes cinctipes]
MYQASVCGSVPGCWFLSELLSGCTAFRMWVWQCLVTKALLLQWLLWFVSQPALTSSIMTPQSMHTPKITTTTTTTTTTKTASPPDNSTTTTTNNNNKCIWKELGERNFADNPTRLTIKAAQDPANISVVFVAKNNTGGIYEKTLHEEGITSTPQNVSLYSNNLGSFGITFYAQFMDKNYSDSLSGEFTSNHFRVLGNLVEWSWVCEAEDRETSLENSRSSSTSSNDVKETTSVRATNPFTNHYDQFSSSTYDYDYFFSTTTTNHYDHFSSINHEGTNNNNNNNYYYYNVNLDTVTQITSDLIMDETNQQTTELPDTTQQTTTTLVSSEKENTTSVTSSETSLGEYPNYSSSSTDFPTTYAATTVMMSENVGKSQDTSENNIKENNNEGQDFSENNEETKSEGQGSSTRLPYVLLSICVVVVVICIVVILYKRHEQRGHLDMREHENNEVAGKASRGYVETQGESGTSEVDEYV